MRWSLSGEPIYSAKDKANMRRYPEIAHDMPTIYSHPSFSDEMLISMARAAMDVVAQRKIAKRADAQPKNRPGKTARRTSRSAQSKQR